jgi:hypothetical protein
MKSRPSLFAAIAATGAAFIAVSPLLYGMLMLHFVLPNPPEWIVVFFILGIPSTTVLDAALGNNMPSNSTARLAMYVGAMWLTYFALFRLVAFYPSLRAIIRRSADWYAARSEQRPR